MALVAAGSTVAVNLPANTTMTFSGMGTHQTSPPGSNGMLAKQLTPINSQPQSIGPLPVATTVNIMATAGGSGVRYMLSSTSAARDTLTADLVSVSRNLTQADNGQIIPVANSVTLTAAAGTLVNFSAILLPAPGATASLAFSGGATGNGASTTITRTRSANIVGFAVTQDPTSGADAFAVGGA